MLQAKESSVPSMILKTGQLLFPERELANAVPWSLAGQLRSLVALILALFPVRALAGAVLGSRAGQFQSIIVR